MTKIRFNELGQGFYDFEYLESITSKDFVDLFKYAVSSKVKNEIKVIDEGWRVVVYIVNFSVGIYIFEKESKNINIVHLTDTALKDLFNMVVDYND